MKVPPARNQSNPVSIVTNGLTIWYDAANLNSYTGSGTNWRDMSPSGRNGTLTNSPGFTASFGGGIVFDGTNDYIAIPDNAINSNANFTMNFWMRNTAAPGTTRTLYGVQNNSNNTGRFQFRCEDTTLAALRNGIIRFAGWSSAISLNTNHYVTISLTKSTNTWEVYVNAVSRGTVVSNQTFTDTTMAIGSARTFDGELFLGNIYAFHHYNRVLSASEILQNFQAHRGRYGV